MGSSQLAAGCITAVTSLVICPRNHEHRPPVGRRYAHTWLKATLLMLVMVPASRLPGYHSADCATTSVKMKAVLPSLLSSRMPAGSSGLASRQGKAEGWKRTLNGAPPKPLMATKPSTSTAGGSASYENSTSRKVAISRKVAANGMLPVDVNVDQGSALTGNASTPTFFQIEHLRPSPAPPEMLHQLKSRRPVPRSTKASSLHLSHSHSYKS